MIILCPYCGHKLRNKLRDGITCCENCVRIFDSSTTHKILSALWMFKNWHVETDVISRQCELNDFEIHFVGKYIIEEGIEFDELVALLKDYDYNKVA